MIVSPLKASSLQAYREASYGDGLEASLREMMAAARPLTDEATRNHRLGGTPYHTEESLRRFFREELVEPLSLMAEDPYRRKNITRGGNRPGFVHIETGALILQALGFPNSTVLTYIGHDFEEDSAEDAKDLDRLRKDNPLVHAYGFPPEIAWTSQLLSDNHMFFAKQLRNETQKHDAKHPYYNVKPQTIERQLKDMGNDVSDPDLQKVLDQVHTGFRNMKEKGMRAPDIMTWLNRNSFIYHEYINHIGNSLEKLLDEGEGSYEERERRVTDTTAGKSTDGLNNNLDLNYSDSQRKIRRIVKGYDITRLNLRFYHLLDKKTRFLHHALAETLIKQTDNFRTFLNIPEKQDRKSLEDYQRTMEEKLKVNPNAAGYVDREMMKRHEAKALEIQGTIADKGYREALDEYKRSGEAEEVLHEARFPYGRKDVRAA